MSRYKRHIQFLGLALLAVLAFSAMAAAGAQAAPRWKVATKFLESGQTKPLEGKATESSLLAVPGLGLTLECKKNTFTSTAVGSAAGSPGTAKATSVTYTECSVKGTTKCTVNSVGQAGGTVKTNALKGELAWLASTGEAAGIRLTPEVGTVFVEIEITGPECPVAQEEALPVKGSVIGEIKPVATEVTEGEIVFPSPSISRYWTGGASRTEHTGVGLTFGGQVATYTGKEVNVKTNGGEAGGVFEG
jgi:hypothetical protein